MSGFLILVSVLVVLVVAYQVYVSLRVARVPYYTDQQRLWQLIMIWAVPIIGATFSQLMLSDTEASEASDGETHSGGTDPDGQDSGYGWNDGDDGGGH
jgi:hypothetical protein